MEILRSHGLRGEIYSLLHHRMGAGRPGLQWRIPVCKIKIRGASMMSQNHKQSPSVPSPSTVYKLCQLRWIHLSNFKLSNYQGSAGEMSAEAAGELNQDSMSEGLQTCYRYLKETGRSYTAIFQPLDREVRDAVCICYVIFRALDTVEDDMTISLETKIPVLRNFHTFLYDPEWRFTGSKDKCRRLLEDFPTISQEFRNLAAVYQEVIADTLQKIGAGFVKYLDKEVESLEDWDEYGHYASGLLELGFLRLVSAAKLEDPLVGQDTPLTRSLGLLMQKTNMIRDYLEDQLDGREFWPKEVWSKYAMELSDFSNPENTVPAVQCMNELITNALQHVPDMLSYLPQLKNQTVFNCFAVSKLLAVATLAACYNNQQVFKGVVKISRDQFMTLKMEATSMQAVKAIVLQYVEEIHQKIPPSDPSSRKMQQIILSIRKLCMSSES
uniref:Squalene synthase n=1 Tax=Leptobrachium leishanense TaxID=445787 RepID=A0A8C5MIG4_9ANUR